MWYSMLHRLPSSNDLPVLNEIQPDLHPSEVLFEKLAQAIGLYDHWVDQRKVPPNEREFLGLHAMQGVLWNTLGGFRGLHRRSILDNLQDATVFPE